MNRYKNSVPRDKTRVHTGPRFPILMKNDFPDSCSNAYVEAGVYFLKAGEWYTDDKDEIYFIDRFTNETVYFNKIDTANQYHLLKGQFIVTDLLHRVSYLPVEKGSKDSARYWPTKIEFKHIPEHKVAARITEERALEINTNRKYGLDGNIYTLMSMFRHESFHVQEKVNNKKGYSYIEHASVYEQQMLYPEFFKTSESFQVNAINQYALRVFNQYCKLKGNGDLITIDVLSIQEKLQNFNNGTGKIIGAHLKLKEKYPKKNKQVNHEITVQYKNKTYNSVQFRLLEDPGN